MEKIGEKLFNYLENVVTYSSTQPNFQNCIQIVFNLWYVCILISSDIAWSRPFKSA